MSGLNNDLHVALSDIFEAAASEVLTAASSDHFTKVSDTIECGYAGVLPLHGDMNGLFILKTNANSLRIFTSYLIGVEQEDVTDEDMCDCIGEIANVVCGLAKARAAMQGIHFTLSTPFCVKSEQSLEFFFKKNEKKIAFALKSQSAAVDTRIILT